MDLTSEMFKVRRPLAFIREHRSESPGVLLDGLLGEVLTFSRGHAPRWHDHLIQAAGTAGAASSSLGENLQ